MTTKLTGPLKREVVIGEVAHTLTLDEHCLKLTRKGKRNGLVLRWEDLVSGEAALAVALNASLSALAASRTRQRAGTHSHDKPAVLPGRRRPKAQG